MAAHDPVALAEIDLYSDLMIAAAATPFDRLPTDRIDEVLRVDGTEGKTSLSGDRRVPPQRLPECGEVDESGGHDSGDQDAGV